MQYWVLPASGLAPHTLPCLMDTAGTSANLEVTAAPSFCILNVVPYKKGHQSWKKQDLSSELCFFLQSSFSFYTAIAVDCIPGPAGLVLFYHTQVIDKKSSLQDFKINSNN